MCKFKSGILFSNGDLFTNPFTDSHEELLDILEIKESLLTKFVRVEFLPGKDMTNIDSYTLSVDESITPEWFESLKEQTIDKFKTLISKMIITTDKLILIDGQFIVAGNANIRKIKNCRIESISDSAQVESISDSAQVESISGSAQVESISGLAQVKSISDSAQVESISDSAQVESISGSAQVKSISGSAQVQSIYGSAQVKSISDSAQVESISGSAQVQSIYGSAQVKYISDSAKIINYKR